MSCILVTSTETPPVLVNEPLPTAPPEYESCITDFPPCDTTVPVPAGIEIPVEAAILEGGVHTTDPPDNAGVTDVRAVQLPTLNVPTRPERCPLLNFTFPWLALVHRFNRPVTVTVVLEVPPVFKGGLKVIFPWNEQVVEPVRTSGPPCVAPLPLPCGEATAPMFGEFREAPLPMLLPLFPPATPRPSFPAV